MALGDQALAYSQPANGVASYNPPPQQLSSAVPPSSGLTGAGTYDSQAVAAAAGATPQTGVPGMPAIQPPPALARLPGGPAKSSFQPTSRSTKTTSKEGQFGPEVAKLTEQALKSREELSQAQIGAEGAQGSTQSTQQYLLAQFDAQQAASGAARRADQEKQLKAHHDNVEALMKEASDMKVDPDSYMNHLGVGGRLVQALQMAVLGFSHGYTGRGMSPAEWLNGRIRDSIQSQIENIRAKRESSRDAREAYKELRDKFGDDDRAAMAMELAQRQYVQANLARWASDQTAPAMSRLRAAQIGSDLDKDRLSLLEHLDDRTIQTIEKSGSERYQAGSPGGLGSVGVRVTLDDGSRAVIPAAQAKELGLVPKSALEQRGEQADVTLKEANAVKATNAAKQTPEAQAGQMIERAGKDVGSLNPIQHPIDYLAQDIQGSQGFEKQKAIQAWDETVMGLIKKRYGRIGSLQDLEKLSKAYTLGSQWNALSGSLSAPTEGTIKSTIARAKKNLAGEAPEATPAELEAALAAAGGGEEE